MKRLLAICPGFKVLLCNAVVAAVLIVFAASCASTTGTTTSQRGKYSEDLSGLRFRPDSLPQQNEIKDTPVVKNSDRIPVEPRYTVNAELNKLIDSVDLMNKARREIDGYSILVFSGSGRENALKAKRDFDLAFPDFTSQLSYSQPNFRVTTGRYLSRLEAQKDFHLIESKFRNAIVIPEKIPIPR